MSRLPEIIGNFALLSLLAFGGANAVMPEMHRLAVDRHGWMTDADFADLFALAQAAPGPNAMIVTLIGLRAAGIGLEFMDTVAAAKLYNLLTSEGRRVAAALIAV